MKKPNKIIIGFVILALLVGGFFVLNSYIYNEKQAVTADDYKNAEFIIEGERITLGGEARYFGNDLMTDLNDDGRDDVIFLITHEPGGSGTFYYAVAALNTEYGYIGSDGYFLGDRIAPQTIEESQNPRHVNVIVVNYADRAPGEPMTAEPSVGKSVYLKLDPTAMQWGIVEPDFEGESVLPLADELILNCQQDIPREKIDDSVLDIERGTVTVYWWDGQLQDNVSLILPYQPETDFAGCSESVRDFLRHIQDTYEDNKD